MIHEDIWTQQWKNKHICFAHNSLTWSRLVWSSTTWFTERIVFKLNNEKDNIQLTQKITQDCILIGFWTHAKHGPEISICIKCLVLGGACSGGGLVPRGGCPCSRGVWSGGAPLPNSMITRLRKILKLRLRAVFLFLCFLLKSKSLSYLSQLVSCNCRSKFKKETECTFLKF